MYQINGTLFFVAAALAVGWGFLWAHILNSNEWWRWAAIRRTWLTVVVGVVGSCLIMFVVLPWQHVAIALVIFAASSLGIIRRSLSIERKEDL